jgi:hypothetical protein
MGCVFTILWIWLLVVSPVIALAVLVVVLGIALIRRD